MGFLRGTQGALLNHSPFQTFEQSAPASQKAVICADKRESIEGVAGASAGVEFRGPTHRARNHFSGELWINMLSVSWAFLTDETIYVSEDYRI